MLLPFAFCMPMTYWTLRTAAEMRHAMVGWDGPSHRAAMRLVYGL